MGSTLKKKSERVDLVKELMNLLGLTKSANTIVGNAKVRGLSGGERKRLSIACEMISSPSLIMLDEPTSGLDSYQATQVVETLRKLADKGKTIVSVIHQPSQHTFQLFDDLLLVSEGKLMYFGEVSKVREYMTGLGYGCESEVGTAEHVLDCVSRVVGADADVERDSIARIEAIAKAAKKQSNEVMKQNDEGGVELKKVAKKMKHIVDRTHIHPGVNIFRQFKLLLGRALRETFRGKAAIIIKVVQQLSLGVIYGGIYTLGDNQASIMDRFGLLSLIVIGATNMAMAGTIRSFPKEKTIVSSEMATSMYRTGPYFIAKAISELPLIGVYNAIFGALIYPLAKLQAGKFKTFLALTSLHSIASEAVGLLIGSIAPSSDVALALFPPIIVLNIIFDGKNISEENTPAVLRWINKVGLVRWGFSGLALNEFEGLAFNTKGPRRGPITKTGEEALARFGLDGMKIADVIGAETKIIVGCWLLSFVGLALTRQRHEVMQSPLK
jgi:energy-coupling factor transporter ATP-binding protein EcfA2/ABC-type multidrug transport system permease subunit